MSAKPTTRHDVTYPTASVLCPRLRLSRSSATARSNALRSCPSVWIAARSAASSCAQRWHWDWSGQSWGNWFRGW